MPTYVIYIDGKEVKRMSGGKKKKLVKMLDHAVEAAHAPQT